MADPLAQVREGMDVVDASGEKVGTVESIKMGDPEAATTQGQTGAESDSFLSSVSQAIGAGEAPDVHRQRAEHLLRVGYVKIDHSGMFSGHGYAAADEVDRVENDRVYLKPNR